jgi:hypothetical protein
VIKLFMPLKGSLVVVLRNEQAVFVFWFLVVDLVACKATFSTG